MPSAVSGETALSSTGRQASRRQQTQVRTPGAYPEATGPGDLDNAPATRHGEGMVDTLLRGHAAFRSDYVPRQRSFLHQLASEHQSPGALYIGCSDSRVIPELLTSSHPGELFVLRNVANIVPPLSHADSSVGAAIEYAVGALHVQHIIVCGHTGCGGIHALLEGRDLAAMPSVREWLEVARPALATINTTAPDRGWDEAVCHSALLQLDHLLTYPCVAEAVAADRVDLHAWVYDMHAMRLLVYDPEVREFLPPNASSP